MSGYCSNCGNVLPPAARFCSACGAVVTGVPPVGYAPYTTYPAGPRLVRLRDTQDQPIAIEGVTADDAAVSCSWAAGPDNQATLKLQVDRARLRNPTLHTQIRVQVISPVREILTIPVEFAME